MPGMATPAQLASLQKATGKAFDTLFLQLMIKHHEGAVTMSGQQEKNGSDIRVGEMAQDVDVTQTKENRHDAATAEGAVAMGSLDGKAALVTGGLLI